MWTCINLHIALSATSIYLVWSSVTSRNGLPVSYSLLLAEKRPPANAGSEADSSSAGSVASTRAATGAPDEKPTITSAGTGAESASGETGADGGSTNVNAEGDGSQVDQSSKLSAEVGVGLALGVQQERDEGPLREVYAGAAQSFTADGLRPYTTYAVRVRARTQLQSSAVSAPPLQVTTLEACTAPASSAAGSAPLHVHNL